MPFLFAHSISKATLREYEPRSTDEEYTRLTKHLRSCLKTLAKKIEPKVYEHRFLMGSLT